MQLKGLVRFFTILLVLYSIYQLSFTWVVRSHEKKLEARAKKNVQTLYPEAKKFKNPEDYPDSIKAFYDARIKRLEDSTKNVTITYGLNGKISYQKAKESELNLGLDLQGGMNVTLEVELAGLLKSMSNNSTDPLFLKAIENADKRKANSSADFITLFAEEYQKLNPNGRLAAIFATAGQDKIKISDNNATVISSLRKEARDAFDRTYKILRTRIDQFGVAQPSINPDQDRAIINVELPGIRDEERVKNYLQSTANLQFWEVYSLADLVKTGSYLNASNAFTEMMGGKVARDTTKQDTTKNRVDTANKLSPADTSKAKTSTATNATKTHLEEWIIPHIYQGNQAADVGEIGYVKSNDTAIVRSYLESPAIRSKFPSDLVWMYGKAENEAIAKNSQVPLYAIKTNGRQQPELEGDVITSAHQDYQNNQVEVTMSMNTRGTRIWANMTERNSPEKNNNRGRSIAIAVDNIIYSAPAVQGKIDGGRSSITGSFTIEQAQDLANLLEIGKLPTPAKIVQYQVVGPTLGKDAINGGLKAFAISFIVIFLLMLVYYNTSGWIANIALILNLLFTVGVLTGLGATLTAPGIAGLVLTIGMAVDTNVIIYERIKEELTKGSGYIPAIKEGYKRSLPPVLDAHVTVLLTAIILFSFGLGPVKGFATTQILGILLSLFCGILVSRWVTDWFTDKKRHLEYFTGISQRIFKHVNFKFIEYRKIAYGISIIVLILGVASFFNGFDEGVEFKGGRSFQVRFAEKPPVEKIRDELKVNLAGAPSIKTVGDVHTLDITTSYLIDDTRPQGVVDSLVKIKLFEGLKPYFPTNFTYAQFDKAPNNIGKLGSKKVLPTISDDLKSGAKKATIIALLIITLYIFIRFRDWRYSLGTIVALLHDVFVTLAVFSFARSIVPFPLEIDQHFIAAVLTVVGFSMNDTVIVFDRIREYGRQMTGATKESIINNAINHTLSRTIMTSLTVFLTILILFIVGGEVTRGFAFAMLVGVITGTYSSVFVAAPILVDLARNKPLGKADTVVEVKQKVSSTPSSKPATAK
ncbi:MAG TPA: protein translocase subunit SecDF [Chitinophagaceae bacterium]|nr:protein translocase subunit SecDF [Chitinophagaceae bacterium]